MKRTVATLRRKEVRTTILHLLFRDQAPILREVLAELFVRTMVNLEHYTARHAITKIHLFSNIIFILNLWGKSTKPQDKSKLAFKKALSA